MPRVWTSVGTFVSLDCVSGIASQIPVPTCYQLRVKVSFRSHVYRCEVVACSEPPFLKLVGKNPMGSNLRGRGRWIKFRPASIAQPDRPCLTGTVGWISFLGIYASIVVFVSGENLHVVGGKAFGHLALHKALASVCSLVNKQAMPRKQGWARRLWSEHGHRPGGTNQFQNPCKRGRGGLAGPELTDNE